MALFTAFTAAAAVAAALSVDSADSDDENLIRISGEPNLAGIWDWIDRMFSDDPDHAINIVSSSKGVPSRRVAQSLLQGTTPHETDLSDPKNPVFIFRADAEEQVELLELLGEFTPRPEWLWWLRQLSVQSQHFWSYVEEDKASEQEEAMMEYTEEGLKRNVQELLRIFNPHLKEHHVLAAFYMDRLFRLAHHPLVDEEIREKDFVKSTLENAESWLKANHLIPTGQLSNIPMMGSGKNAWKMAEAYYEDDKDHGLYFATALIGNRRLLAESMLIGATPFAFEGDDLIIPLLTENMAETDIQISGRRPRPTHYWQIRELSLKVKNGSILPWDIAEEAEDPESAEEKVETLEWEGQELGDRAMRALQEGDYETIYAIALELLEHVDVIKKMNPDLLEEYDRLVPILEVLEAEYRTEF